MNDSQPSIFENPINRQESEKKRDEAMHSADVNANEAYKIRVVEVIYDLCQRHPMVTSDDVANEMAKYPETTHTKRVIGPMFKRAQKLGYCEPYICKHCGMFVTRQKEDKDSHAVPMHIWKSRIYDPHYPF